MIFTYRDSARYGCDMHHLGPSVALANAASSYTNNVLSLFLGQTTSQDGVTVEEG